MRAGRFRGDVHGRVPFALVAVMLLVASVALAGLVAQIQFVRNGVAADDAERAISIVKTGIRARAVELAASVLQEGIRRGLGPENMTMALEWSFREGFAEEVLNGTGLDGWSLALVDEDIGIDLGAMPDGRVVGTVSWTGVSPNGIAVSDRVDVAEDLGRPLALAHAILERLAASGDEGGELGRLVEGMLYRLAAVRAAGGELGAEKVLSKKDVGMALELAVRALMNSSDDPGAMLLDVLNITTVRASAVLAQYVLGLSDYYLLWFRDYTGIGETAESFFHWVGEATDGDKEGQDARERWYEDLRVQYLVERWAFDVLRAALHHALERSGGEDIDVRALGLEDVSKAVEDVVNLTAGGPVGDGFAGPPPDELASALDKMPCNDASERDAVLASLRDGLEGTALNALDGLMEVGRGIANRAWDEVLATARLREISDGGASPILDRNGTGGEVVVVKADLRWDELDYDSDVDVSGIHDTAPEGRLRRALGAAMAPGKGLLFSEVRPYETDYHIEIQGKLVVHDIALSSVDRLTSVERNAGFDLELAVPIDISIDVPVLTGLPMDGVGYRPSDTLCGDLSEALWEFMNRTWSGLRWASAAMFRLFHGLEDGLRELGRRGLENLGTLSAASFSRVVEGVMRSLYEKAWNEAINQTWRFLRKLIGDDLRDMLTFNATVNGLRVMVQFDLFDERINLSYSADDAWFNLTLKRLAEDVPPFRPMPVEGFRYALLGTGELRRGGLFVHVGLDPLTVVQPSVLQVVAERRDAVGKGYRVELSAPVAEKAYRTFKVSLSSVIGSPLKGIPIPGTGMTFDVDAGIKISYDAEIQSPEKWLVKALRAAWYKTLEGYSVRSLYEDLGDPALLEAFLMNLLNNIGNSVEDVASNELPELEVFIEGKASAGLGTASGGFSLSFVIKEPVRVLWDLIPWFGDCLKAFLQRMAQPGLPSVSAQAPSTVMGRLFVRGFLYSDAGLPDFFGLESARASIGGTVEANLPAFGEALGKDLGRWTVRAGVVMPDLPSHMAEMIPGFDAPGSSCDLWLVQLAVSELDNDRAKLSEVYYDTEGYDPRQEFVEVWNPTATRMDLSRWVLSDRGGDWRLPDHLELGPGERMVVARNRDGFRAEFGTLPRVAGLTLSLDNEGDALYLYDPWGVRIDEVGWKNGLHGWELRCKSGESLHRGPIDTDTPMDWGCGPPDPGR